MTQKQFGKKITSRIKANLEQIHDLQERGFTLNEIVDELKKDGFEVKRSTLSSALWRLSTAKETTQRGEKKQRKTGALSPSPRPLNDPKSTAESYMSSHSGAANLVQNLSNEKR
jgi:arginine repressor